MNSYQVGQILFLIANSKVVPLQVIEEVTRTTLQGKEVSHIVMFPDKNQTQADIKNIKGEIFKTKEAAKSHMIKNANEAIEKLIEQAEDMCATAFNTGSPEDYYAEKEDNFNHEMQNDDNNNIIKVDLGNGTIGKINTNELAKAGGL